MTEDRIQKQGWTSLSDIQKTSAEQNPMEVIVLPTDRGKLEKQFRSHVWLHLPSLAEYRFELVNLSAVFPGSKTFPLEVILYKSLFPVPEITGIFSELESKAYDSGTQIKSVLDACKRVGGGTKQK